MIENHEEITEPLTAAELEKVPAVLSVLRQHRKGTEIKSGAVTSICCFRFSFDLSSATLRKIIAHIRRTGLEAVCGSSKGYYIAVRREEVESQVRSLRQRAAAITAAADGLEKCIPPAITQGRPIDVATIDEAADMFRGLTHAEAGQKLRNVLSEISGLSPEGLDAYHAGAKEAQNES